MVGVGRGQVAVQIALALFKEAIHAKGSHDSHALPFSPLPSPSQHLTPFAPAPSRVDPNVFRKRRLYTPECHAALEAHMESILLYYTEYSSAECEDEVLQSLGEEASCTKSYSPASLFSSHLFPCLCTVLFPCLPPSFLPFLRRSLPPFLSLFISTSLPRSLAPLPPLL